MEKEPDKINRTVNCLPSMPALPHETGTQNKIPEYFPELSFRISDVLDEIGAGERTVMERRETYLLRERMMTIAGQNSNHEYFHFGSQSEGTTTPGLNSDIDLLMSYKERNIMTDWRDWEAGMVNFLMLRDDITPPQQYLLQHIHKYTPEAVTIICEDRFVRKDSGQVLFSSERWKQEQEQVASRFGEVTKNGPSVSSIPEWDMVMAFPVCKPLPEIQHWIDRCRGRHWPPAQLLKAARKAPCFLVPAGHPDSDYKREEFRLSPNLIERMLMFSFNMTQIKCYIVLKLIKKTLFSKIVGDFVTSYHCKTLMFTTIERTHPSLWKEHNIMYLLLLCLKGLRKWLRLGCLPHYIIAGVNLFDGKLSMVKQKVLLQYVDYLIKNGLQDLSHIDIDNLGCRLQACCIRRIRQGGEGELGGVVLRYSISLLLKFGYLNRLLLSLTGIIYRIQSSNSTFQQGIYNTLRTAVQCFTNEQFKTVAFDHINHLYAVYNSVQSFKCLRLPNTNFIEIIRRFKFCLNTDIASSRLKLASLLYCFGHFHAAARALEDVEKRCHSKVKALCGVRQLEGQKDLRVFANMISDNCDNVRREPPFAFCVRFIREEAHCAPYVLWFEMNRAMTEEEVAQRNAHDKMWMDYAEVDACPFLHYLQYLTYGGQGERTKQLYALEVLESYILNSRNIINMHHPETAFNLLGHCYEMEGDYQAALYIYEKSLDIVCGFNTNNAANWHIQRVQRLISNLY
ncbi:uncharacterized protein LOC127864485 isoform X2 [Dreissena polymorpha]|uniref:Mab-21-like HhH/H2TH-like domain-containing protein n=1 Tax=Dreissena polymorpha TaxID=45954 RepID=A0A9D4S9N8_DREPO|nr:uncharacterized protein LOC127864485 isoform X2 [Dreissena polymorpha]KAH3896926.1 hypothetical protein DPMN_021110 [Dreissena polymorpha]